MRCAPYCARPTTVAKRGASTESLSPPICSDGVPTRTPVPKTSLASSALPCIAAAPPVSTTPAASLPAKPADRDVALHEVEDLVHALVDDVRQQLARDLPVALRDGARQLDDLARVHQRLVRAAVLLLQPLGVGLRHAEAVHDVARDVVAAEGDRAEVADLPLVEDGEVGRARAHLDERDAELLLVLGQHGERAGERLEHELAHLVAGALDALAQVDRRRRADRDEVHLRLEPRAAHPDRIADAGVLVDGVLLRDGVQQLAVLRDRLRARHLVRAIDVGLVDLVVAHGDDALGGHRLHVLAGDAGVHVGDRRARHALGVLQRLADRARRLLDVGHDAAAHAGRARLADAEHLDRRMLRQVADDLGDDGGRLGRADVESGDEAFRVHGNLAITWSR